MVGSISLGIEFQSQEITILLLFNQAWYCTGSRSMSGARFDPWQIMPFYLLDSKVHDCHHSIATTRAPNLDYQNGESRNDLQGLQWLAWRREEKEPHGHEKWEKLVKQEGREKAWNDKKHTILLIPYHNMKGVKTESNWLN